MDEHVEIELTRGKVALVSVQDADRVLQHKWYAQHTDGLWYGARTIACPKQMIFMHTFITGYKRTDHINGDGLDNRRSNLRETTQRQNVQNARKTSGKTSKYKGVSWYKPTRSWRVQIHVNGHKIYLGVHKDEEHAAKVYDSAARSCFGPFDCLNFPDVGERSAITGNVRIVM